MPAEIDPLTLDQIKTILRRDLKLGPDVQIADDMPFFGGEVDLDSLDMLLLVTSLEKQFGIKVPNEAVGREVFQNVQTLTAYVQNNKPATAATMQDQSTDKPASWDDLINRLPHGPEFRFVSRVLDVKLGEFATAEWVLTGSEPFFAGHFPGRPIVPGVLIAESLAQVSGMIVYDGSREGALAKLDMRFETPVVPPATIRLEAKMLRRIGALQICDVRALVGEAVAARGTVTLFRG